ncbi:MAG TPA: NADH-quinone oxidoreductase subunit L [Gemmataceae bacterium]|nr:NADH-quinone oxidoreductase subunit L [Gemmataceae bacterium]
MSDVAAYVWLIPVLPLAAAVVAMLMGLTRAPAVRHQAHWPVILAVVASCVLSFCVFFSMPAGEGAVSLPYYTWFRAGDVDVGFTLRVDSLTVFMLLTVTFVGSLITIYSAGYMHGDEGYPRFFMEVALFVFSMTGLVLADNYLLLYGFWEGVGLCSYLLIGFWFTKPSAADAARKAFLTTRLGDIGLFLGILLLWAATPGHPIHYDGIFAQAPLMNPGIRTIACLLLFCGAVGKSAQFPLYVWLPDAMEGPTPVSALIHAATMVTAGVYLVARSTPLFGLAPDAQLVVACIGGFTALLAALIAITQNDLKRVLAYSTISQLGYMFLGVGSGAVASGMFHLFTHAFFKALLFLAAGSVMHAMGGVIDMRRIGGLRKVMPVTHWTFLCGALALAGVPFVTSGFWSKDDIIAGLLNASHVPGAAGGIYAALFVLALVTAGITAFYTFRAYFLTFWGEAKIPHEAGHHAHESPPVMTGPLVVLAFGAILVGFFNAAPFTESINHFLARTPDLRLASSPELTTEPRLALWAASLLLAAAGIGGAWWVYVRQPGLAPQLARHFAALYQFSLNKFYVDELYEVFILRPLGWVAQACRVFDFNVVDGLVDLTARFPKWLGIIFRPMQNGLLQFYALAMILGLAMFLIALARSL